MVHQSHVGKFTLRSHGQLLVDGRYSATFAVTEHTGEADLDSSHATGLVFDSEDAAEDAGMKAALAWLDERDED